MSVMLEEYPPYDIEVYVMKNALLATNKIEGLLLKRTFYTEDMPYSRKKFMDVGKISTNIDKKK